MDKLLAEKSANVHVEPKISKLQKKASSTDITDSGEMVAAKTACLPLDSKHFGKDVQPQTGSSKDWRNSTASSLQEKSKPKLQEQSIVSPSKPSLKFSQTIGSKVTFYDRHNRQITGKLRWVGKNEGVDMLGIEAVSLTANEKVVIYIW